MDLLLVGQAFALILCAIAAYFDIRSGIIPDRLNYLFIAIGILINLVAFNLAAFGIAAAVFVFGYLLYLGGKIGGGDVKMFVALALLIPLQNGRVFIIDLLLVASIVALVGVSVYYLVKYARKGIKLEDNKKNIPFAAIMLLLSAGYVYAFYSFMHASLFFIGLLSIILLCATAFVALERGIRKEFFLEKVSLGKLDEDEIIAYDFIDERTKKIILGEGRVLKGVLGSGEIENLKKAKINEIPVYRSLPKFAPFVLVALVALLAFPNIVEMLIFL